MSPTSLAKPADVVLDLGSSNETEPLNCQLNAAGDSITMEAQKSPSGADSSGGLMDRFVERILTNYRWVFVCLFLLPMSLVYDIWYSLRAWIVFQMNSAPENHKVKVEAVQKQVEEWGRRGRNTPMCTARPGWQTMSFRVPKYKETMFRVNINLVDIVDLDVERLMVTVEPLVTMGQLTKLLLSRGWTLPILPELDDLTVGGLVMGTGVETSSHKYGLFQHICNSFELVLSSGELVRCSKEKNSDLFYAVPWSYGTLGFLTAVELHIVPAKKYVKLDYIPVSSLDQAVNVFSEKTDQPHDNQFVEGLMYGKDRGVIMVGNMVDYAVSRQVNRIGLWFKPWFFKHVEKFLSTGARTEYIPLRQYYHRHSRSLFWEIQEIIPFGNNPFFRYFFGWMSPPKVSLLKLTQTNSIKRLYEANHMIQDMLVPMAKLKDALLVFHEQTEIYPLWLCPFKLANNPGMLHPVGTEESEMFVDIGAYGIPKTGKFHPVETTRNVEAFVRKVNGYQMLYADTYMTKDEFREMFDHRLYDEARIKYDCLKAFPDVYDKISRNARS